MKGKTVWGVCLLCLMSSVLAESRPPNVVILFADDLGYGDLGSYGHPYNRTPHLDQLAQQGQRWTDFYVASAVCSPSRGALLTGRLPVRTGLYGKQIGVYFPNEPNGFPASETTLAEALRAVGYRTAIVGKWHLGDAPDAWPTRHGFDQWFGLPYSNDMDWVDELDIDALVALRAQGDLAGLQRSLAGRAGKYANPKQAYWNVPLLRSTRLAAGDTRNTEPDTRSAADQSPWDTRPASHPAQDTRFRDQLVERPAQQDSLTRRYTAEAVAFIEASKEQPFFLYLPYTMPHTPLFRSDAFAGRSLGGRYGDVLEEMDWSVGEIVGAIDDAGVAGNTLVIFTSDNGPWLTMNTEGGQAGVLRHGKGTTFEGGMRVPAIFSWPGQIPADTVSALGSTLDLFPTVAALAGADGSTAVDGVDLSSRLFTERSPGSDQSDREEFPYYRSGQLYAYRYGPWKLHFITEGAYQQPPQRTVHETPQLYHLLRDPGEKFDVASEFPEVVRRIEAAVAQHKKRVDTREPLFDARLARLTR